MPGKTTIVESGRDTTILLDADAGKIAVGNEKISGSVDVFSQGHLVGTLFANPQSEPDPQRPRRIPGGGMLELSGHAGKPPSVVLNGGTGTVRGAVVTANNDEGRAAVRIDGDDAAITIGGEKRGTLIIKDNMNQPCVQIDAMMMKLGIPEEQRINQVPLGGYSLYLHNHAGKATASLNGVSGKLTLGEATDGHHKIELHSLQARIALGTPHGEDVDYRPVELNGDQARVTAGAMGKPGQVHAKAADHRTTVTLDGDTSTITVGVHSHSGHVHVLDHSGQEVIELNGNSRTMTLGGSDRDGRLAIKDNADRTACLIDGNEGAMRLGIVGTAGVFRMADSQGRVAVLASADSATLELGAAGNPGDLNISDETGQRVIGLHGASATVGVGWTGRAGNINVRRSDGTNSIQIVGESGDIILANADCAEEFDFATDNVIPGSVVVIDDDERLTLSTRAYDTRVAGVVSGAGRYRPGIVLDRRAGAPSRPAVAMVGKVECRVDAAHGPVRCGDLLVSSPTPGHAMAATDRTRTAGAVLGKALRGLDDGQGLIPILVCLQ